MTARDQLIVCFEVLGLPQPAGSKRAFVRAGRAVVVDDNPASRGWKQHVQSAAREAYAGAPLTGPLAVRVVFLLPRPAGHYGTGRNAGTVRASAPVAPAVKPDALKLARAVEDALTGVVYRDDAQTVDLHVVKRYAPDGVARTVVTVVREVAAGGDARAAVAPTTTGDPAGAPGATSERDVAFCADARAAMLRALPAEARAAAQYMGLTQLASLAREVTP